MHVRHPCGRVPVPPSDALPLPLLLLPLLPLQSSGFEVELWSYLEALKLRPRDALYCRDLLARHDFSAARAHIIASGGWSASDGWVA